MADLLHSTDMADCKPVLTPMTAKLTTCPNGAALYHDETNYRKIVGTLQYLTLTRLDLTFVVNIVCQHMHACQYMHAPTNAHFMMVERIF